MLEGNSEVGARMLCQRSYFKKAGYDTDITRTIPVSGRFSDLQKAVYNAVLQGGERKKNLRIRFLKFSRSTIGWRKVLWDWQVGAGHAERRDSRAGSPAGEAANAPAWREQLGAGSLLLSSRVSSRLWFGVLLLC